MWCEIAMRRTVILHPQYMSPQGGHRRWIVETLLDDVKKLQCSREHGYYVAPTIVTAVSEGKIRDTGNVAFSVDFKCLVFKLIKNEVAELVVETVKQSGVECSCGPYTAIYLHSSQMTGFVLAPEEDDPCFKNGDGATIAKGCVVRARILGMQFMGDGFRCLASINGAYLGVISQE